MTTTNTRHRPIRPRPSDAALAGAYTALDALPASRRWWWNPANRYHAATTIAHRVERHLRQQSPRDTMISPVDLPAFRAVERCPKCERWFAASPPRVAYTTESLEAIRVEYMLCRCQCGWKWRERCADAGIQTWFADAALAAPHSAPASGSTEMPSAPAPLASLQQTAAPELDTTHSRTAAEIPWSAAPLDATTGPGAAPADAPAEHRDPEIAPWARASQPLPHADDVPLYPNRAWTPPDQLPTEFTGTVYDPQAERRAYGGAI